MNDAIADDAVIVTIPPTLTGGFVFESLWSDRYESDPVKRWTARAVLLQSRTQRELLSVESCGVTAAWALEGLPRAIAETLRLVADGLAEVGE